MRAAVLATVLAGALAALQIGGVLGPFIEDDATGIVLGLIALAAFCTALSGYWRKALVWVVENQVCPTLGLLGTVIGFMMTLEGITGDVTAAKMAGVSTALVTTATGMIAHLWLLVVREATRK